MDKAPSNTLYQSKTCQLCGREMHLTRHHLIPKTLHSRRRIRRRFSRSELNELILWICRPCHNTVHNALSEMELAENYNSRDRLLENSDIRHFVDWISTKPEGFKPKSGSKRK